MNKNELNFILQQGEGLKVEFREQAKGLDKDMVAFANAEGGRIFLGVNDQGDIIGINVDNHLKSQIQDIANNCDPRIIIHITTFENILIIEVPEGDNKPYGCKDGYFVRIGPNSQKMGCDDLKKMLIKQGNIMFDELPVPEFDKRDFDKAAFAAYLQKAGVKKSLDHVSILKNLGVFDIKGRMNNAGVLFFSKHPKKYLINAYVTSVRFLGTEKVTILDTITSEGNVVVQLEESLNFIRRNTRTSYLIKGLQREEIPEYPIEALREAILNAVMHRDYLEKGAHVQVDIFDDRIAISNIGALLPPLTKKSLGKLAVRRNPLLADLFHRIKLVEKMGTGLQRIRDECRRHGNVRFSIETNGFFIAIFKHVKYPENVQKMSRKCPENITPLQRRILEVLEANPFLTRQELSKQLHLNQFTVKANLSKLKKLGLLKRIGPDKGGHWEIP